MIEDNGTFLFESAALCLHVADMAEEAALILPPRARDRALAYQWTLFAMTEIEPAVVQVLTERESRSGRAAPPSAPKTPRRWSSVRSRSPGVRG